MIDDLDIMERLSPCGTRCRDGVTVVPTDTQECFDRIEELVRLKEERMGRIDLEAGSEMPDRPPVQVCPYCNERIVIRKSFDKAVVECLRHGDLYVWHHFSKDWRPVCRLAANV